ncbi:MAG: AmmeMemoRadiSam system protein A, partial [Bacteroidales bacterium]
HNTHSPQTRWAREVLKAHFEGRQPERIPDEVLRQQAGCFVSLHNPDESLRGCIGTIMPTKATLEEEIKTNAISAAFMDPRFDPLQKGELEDLVISVDVLGEPESISSFDELDPKVYGVIVSAGNKRGVLLPDLPGIDKVEQQLHIAMQKAGIADGTPIAVHRFKVHRYH